MTDFNHARHDMVDDQLVARGITDREVLIAMRRIPRERFVPEDVREFAYEDCPLPIGWGQTISQPYIVALMAEALELKGDERILDVGTGSGYAAAVLAEIASEVYSVERIPELAALAHGVVGDLGYDNLHVSVGDGALGLKAHAPFDAISVAAGGAQIPPALIAQLAIGGRLVMPVGGPEAHQRLVRLTRTGEDSYEEVSLGMVLFVPLVSAGAEAEC